MNLNELFSIQAKLDERILKKHGLEGQDLIKKKTVALICELYETVNEARFFKFWSHDQKPRTEDNSWYVATKTVRFYQDSAHSYNHATVYQKYDRNPLLEEYVDTIHFALSIANDLNYQSHEYNDPVDTDLNKLTIGLTNLITLLPEVKYHRHIELVFNYLIKLGYSLGFDEEQVINAYYSKNKTNHERQNNSY